MSTTITPSLFRLFSPHSRLASREKSDTLLTVDIKKPFNTKPAKEPLPFFFPTMKLYYALLLLVVAAAPPATAEVRGEKHETVMMLPRHVEEQTLRTVKPHRRGDTTTTLLGHPRGVFAARGSKPKDHYKIKPVQGRMGHIVAASS